MVGTPFRTDPASVRSTNTDAGVGIGMLRGGFRNLIKKAINNRSENKEIMENQDFDV